MSRVPVLVACLFAIAILLPSITAQEEGSDKIPLSTLPLGPDTDTFHISLTNAGATPITTHSCRQDVGRYHYGDATLSREFIYATNDAEDSCRSATSAQGSPHHRGFTSDLDDRTHTFIIHIMPVVEELALDEGETISGTVHMYSQRVGIMQPTVTLETDEGLVGSAWTAPEASTNTDGEEMQWHQFDFDLGAAPAKASGALRLNVTVSITADGVGYSGILGYGVGFTGDQAGFVTIPINSAVGTEEEPDLITCPDGTEVENGTECPEVVETEPGDDNNTTEDDPGTTPVGSSNNTTTPQDNETADPKEKKGLPGFGLVAVLVAGFVGAAVVRRRDLRRHR